MKRICAFVMLLLNFLLLPLSAQEATSPKQYATLAGTGGKQVVYLETASWGQGAPFNEQCWTSASHAVHAPTGCVPTAYAIVMRYHGWPNEGIGKLYDCQLGTIITDRTYDWDNMPLVYDGNWSDEQENEVAKIMSHLGHAFMVTYGAGGTSVSDPRSTYHASRLFNYKEVQSSRQMNFAFDEWLEKIRESLDNGCPVIYASDNAGTGDTRHMFVIDGYTDNDYFHFNFGWNGNGNGWFRLDNIKPYQGDDYSWRIDGTSDHYAIFNFAPNRVETAVSATVFPADAGVVSINGGDVAGSVSCDIAEGKNVTLMATANSGYSFSHWSKEGTVVSITPVCTVKVEPDNNNYIANFNVVSTSETVNVSVEYNHDYGTVMYNDAVVDAAGISPYKNSEVTLEAIPNEGYIFDGWVIDGEEFNSSCITFVVTADMDIVANFSLAEEVYAINNETIRKEGYQSGSTSYCSTWTYNGEPVFTLKTTKNDAEAYALSATENMLFYATAITSNNTQVLSDEITYTLTVPEGYLIAGYSFVCYSNSNSYTVNVTVDGKTTVVNRADDHVISNENINSRTTEFMLSTDYSGRASVVVNEFVVTVKKETAEGGGNSTAIEDVFMDEVVLPVIYDLQGRRINKVTKSGIYIINGKKVLLQ